MARTLRGTGLEKGQAKRGRKEAEQVEVSKRNKEERMQRKEEVTGKAGQRSERARLS